jgi:Zinc finger C-x8-C-x5-C-x3-H type (and similar)
MQPPASPQQQGLASEDPDETGGGSSQMMMMVEDCRDYLRTGRCKYGASCKYNHPSNVQSGGGMKAPVNPGEPMFPLRPAEPICQYYMKHGTCKFGQACKFNHPPPLHHSQHGQSLHALMGGAASGSGSSSNNGSGRTGFSGPTTMLMSLGGHHHRAMVADQSGSGTGAPHSLLCNPIGTDPASGSMILQFLPQRPDEPDCIYFLKNGRCKYGATCRYHHPIAYQPNSSSNNSSSGSSRNQQQQQHQHQRLVIDDPPRRLPPMHSQPVRMVSGGGGGVGINSSRGGSPPDSSSYRAHSGHYVNQMIPAYMTQSSSSSSLAAGGGTNGVQYLNFDTLSSSPLQPVPVVSMDGTTSYAYPIATASSSSGAAAAVNHGNHDHNSSASSLASSYETAGSSLEHLQQQQQQHGDAMASAALWNRARRNGSGGSLNAYYHDGGGGGGTTNARMVSASAKSMPHSASDGNIVGRRNRSTSYGSTSDTSYYDAASTATLSRTTSVGSWRNSNSNSDPSVASMARGPGGGGAGAGRSIPTVQYATAAHDAGDYSNASPSSHRQQQRFAVMMPPGASAGAGVRLRRSPRGGPGGIRRGENDEGFTMMTSALLNMLDAPEELVGYDHEGEEEDDGDEFNGEGPHMYYEAAYPQSAILSQQDPHAMPSDSFDPEFFERLSLSRNASYGVPDRNGGHDGSSWNPGFRDSGGAISNGISHNPPHVLRQGNDDAMQRVIHQHAAAATSTPTHGPTSHGGNGGGGDYGLFLS